MKCSITYNAKADVIETLLPAGKIRAMKLQPSLVLILHTFHTVRNKTVNLLIGVELQQIVLIIIMNYDSTCDS